MQIALNSPKVQALADVALYADEWGLGWSIPVARAASRFVERRELARMKADPLARRVNEVARRNEHTVTDRLLAALEPAPVDAKAEAAPAEPSPVAVLPAETEPDPLEAAREQLAARHADLIAWQRIKRTAEDELLAEGVLTVFDLRSRDHLLDKAVDLVLAGSDALRARGEAGEWQGLIDTDGNPVPLTEASLRELLECDARIEEGAGAGDELGSYLIGAIIGQSVQIDLYRIRTLEALEKNSERLADGTFGGPTSGTKN